MRFFNLAASALHTGDRLNLEFAYAGTGEITDLKLLPDHLALGMGVVDVRSEQLQSVEQIAALATAGAAALGPERIALNPDCGFAPDAGEPPTIDEAFEKLRRLAEAASRLRNRYGTHFPIFGPDSITRASDGLP